MKVVEGLIDDSGWEIDVNIYSTVLNSCPFIKNEDDAIKIFALAFYLYKHNSGELFESFVYSDDDPKENRDYNLVNLDDIKFFYLVLNGKVEACLFLKPNPKGDLTAYFVTGDNAILISLDSKGIKIDSKAVVTEEDFDIVENIKIFISDSDIYNASEITCNMLTGALFPFKDSERYFEVQKILCDFTEKFFKIPVNDEKNLIYINENATVIMNKEKKIIDGACFFRTFDKKGDCFSMTTYVLETEFGENLIFKKREKKIYGSLPIKNEDAPYVLEKIKMFQ